MDSFWVSIQPIIISLVTAVVAALGAVLTALVLQLKSYIIAKIGKTNYDHATEAARGVWIWIRDNHPEWTSSQKIEEMEEQLLQKFPQLTQMELDSINKVVHEELKKIETKCK